MAKVISHLVISGGPDKRGRVDPDWHLPYFDANMGARAVGRDYETADVLLLGRAYYGQLYPDGAGPAAGGRWRRLHVRQAARRPPPRWSFRQRLTFTWRIPSCSRATWAEP